MEMLQRIMAGTGTDYDNHLAEKLGDSIVPMMCAVCGKHKDEHNAIQNKGRALTDLNISNNALCGIDEDGDGDFDASGLIALADAIGKHQ